MLLLVVAAEESDHQPPATSQPFGAILCLHRHLFIVGEIH
jgi:hypothetical protein